MERAWNAIDEISERISELHAEHGWDTAVANRDEDRRRDCGLKSLNGGK